MRRGLAPVVSMRLPGASFEAQTKTKLSNTEAKGMVETMPQRPALAFLEENPAVAKRICAKVADAARARIAARKARETCDARGPRRASLPGKLADCQSRTRRSRRSSSWRATRPAGRPSRVGTGGSSDLPLRGKILNVEKARFDKMLSSVEIATMITALGTGIGSEEFDLAKIRYHKVVIMTDADVDGATSARSCSPSSSGRCRRWWRRATSTSPSPRSSASRRGSGRATFKDEPALEEFLLAAAPRSPCSSPGRPPSPGPI